MRKKTKIMMLGGAVIAAGIGVLCAVNKKSYRTDTDEEDLGITEVFTNYRIMMNEVPIYFLNAIYKKREELYMILGPMVFIVYDDNREVVKVRTLDNENSYVEFCLIDGEVAWRTIVC